VEAATTIRSSDPATTGAVSFFVASAYAKMQAFDKALPFFREAEKNRHDAPSLHYDFGQAYYASQKLKDAEAEFRLSLKAGFKVGASAYYIGFIRQTIEDKKTAYEFFDRIQKMKTDDDGVKQAAMLQMAELKNDEAKEIQDKKKRLAMLEKTIKPLYESVRDFNSEGAAADQARTKLAEIQAQLDADAPRFRNGVPYPRKAYSVSLSQTYGYNSNVITQADDTLLAVSHKDSWVSATSMFAKYQFNWREMFSFTPELANSLTLHSRRTEPKVYQNDNVSISPALRTKYEHTSRGQPATALLDAEFNLMLRDYNQAHQFPFYQRYYGLNIGERVKWFETGTTTVKAGIKLNENYNPARNSYAPAFSFQQNFKIMKTYDLSNTLSADYLHARDDTNDEKNYKLRSSISLTHLIEKIDVNPSLTIGIKDTVKQRPTRGIEKLINPAVGLSRELFSHLDGTFDYSFTRNISHATATYQYSQQEAKMGVSWNL
jgi:hypothetical protein